MSPDPLDRAAAVSWVATYNEQNDWGADWLSEEECKAIARAVLQAALTDKAVVLADDDALRLERDMRAIVEKTAEAWKARAERAEQDAERLAKALRPIAATPRQCYVPPPAIDGAVAALAAHVVSVEDPE